MRFVRGFDREIVEALDSGDALVHYHAVRAAGNWGLEDAWAHISALAEEERTDKDLRLAAIDAVTGIRPVEAAEILRRLSLSGDEDIVEAALEALAVAEGREEGGVFDENGEEDDPFL
jgi:HEAT repeat protein